MDVSQTIESTLREPAGSEESSGNHRLPNDVSDGRVRTRQVPMNGRVGGENPGETAVRPMRKVAGNLATIDNVAEEATEENSEEIMADEVEEEQGTEEDEEGQQPRVMRAPKAPTKAEREEHEATHLPFRSWCTHCLRGRGRNKPHKRQVVDEELDQQKVPKISMDYFFMSQDDEKASENPLLLMADETTGHRYMRAVGRKGIGDNNEMDWLIKDLDEELKSWGYPGGSKEELIFKSDGERAIVAVRETLAKYHGGKITPELAPRGEQLQRTRRRGRQDRPRSCESPQRPDGA
jgi:hypothetical protein